MFPTAASSHSLPDALAARLRPHVPGDVALKPTATGLHADVRGEPWAGSDAVAILDDPEGVEPGEEIDLLVTVTVATLNGIQDAISEGRAEAWPAVPGNASAMPDPGARVANDLLHVWFGDESAPALRLDPIPLADLGLSPIG